MAPRRSGERFKYNRTQAMPAAPGIWVAYQFELTPVARHQVPIPVAVPSRDDAIAACIKEFPNRPCWAWSYPDNDFRLVYDPITANPAGKSNTEEDAAKEARNG